MNKYLIFILCVLAFGIINSCEKDFIQDETTTSTDDIDSGGVNEDSSDYVIDTTDVVHIVLNGNTITIDKTGVASVTGSKITITSAGVYSISGTLTDGQIIVNTEDEASVRLLLNGVHITCAASAPVYVIKATKTIVYLPENIENYLTDGAAYQGLVDEEPNAALFSKSDLTIFGSGSLTVDANYNDGIATKDGLIIKSATIKVDAVDDGIRGKDYLIVYNGNFTVTASGDGFTSDNENNTDLGYVYIKNGTFNITSGGDAISGQTMVKIACGNLGLTSGGGSGKTVSSALSAKGIKGNSSVIIDSATITVSAADDAIHSNGSITIGSGSLTLASGDDGLHAEASIAISEAYLSITKSVEGIEAPSISVNSGNVSIVASDDGFNATKGMGGESNDGSILNLYGGTVYVNASGGDGLDSNGSIAITGGTIIVHGPQSSPEVGMDYNGTCNITGGFLIMSGTNSNMTQGPGTSSSQYSLKLMTTSSNAAGTLFHIQDAGGNDVVTFKPARSYYSIVFSSPELKNGATYSVYTGGTYSGGTNTGGLYQGGTYSAGTSYTSFTISGIVTSIGNAGGGPGR